MSAKLKQGKLSPREQFEFKTLTLRDYFPRLPSPPTKEQELNLMRQKLGLKGEQIKQQRVQISTRDKASRKQIGKISEIHIQDMEQTFRLNSDTSEMTFTRNFRPERSPDAGLDQTLHNSSDEY